MAETHYSTMAPLTGAPSQLRRQIGVKVRDVIDHHAGLGGPAVDVYRETVDFTWTKGLGRMVPAAEAEATITELTKKTIADLDAAIDELYRHRVRLAQEYRRRTSDDPTASDVSPLLRQLITSEAARQRLWTLLVVQAREALAGTQEYFNAVEAEAPDERPLPPADLWSLIHWLLTQIAELER